MTRDIIREKILRYKQEMINTLCDLIKIPTVNPPGQSYRECVEYISAKLSSWGILHQVITNSNQEYPRSSIVGFCGRGDDGIHFHGHYDVVPASDMEQFEPKMKNGLIYGRGSSDMKSGIVVMMFALRILKEFSADLDGRIFFSIVPDEETGSTLGTEYLFENGFLPKGKIGMLMPEPTSGVVWHASKGALTLRINIKGKAAHVALEHKGVNAFETMVALVNDLVKLKKVVKRRTTQMVIKPLRAKKSIMLIGGVTGSGNNFNIVPDQAFFTIDRRINPEERLEHAKQEIMDVIEKCRKRGHDVEVEIVQQGQSSHAAADTELERVLKQSIIDVTRAAPSFELCPGICEIRFFHYKDIPAYAYGPGSIDVAHGPKECVQIKNIFDYTRIYALTALRLLTPKTNNQK